MTPRANLVYSPHPIIASAGRRVCFEAFRAGETIADYLARVGVRLGERPAVLHLNDRPVARADWARISPSPGDLITLRAAAGRGDSNPLRTVLMIAVLIAAPQFGAQLGAALGFGSATAAGIGQALIMVGGTLVVNALVPPPTPRALAAGEGEKESPTYSLTGGQNRARPFEPLPLVFGRHRMVPDLGANPYTEFRGEDQYLYQVFNFGLADVVLSDFKIGDTPIASFTDTETEESDASGALALFPANVDTLAGAALENTGEFIQRTSSLDTARLAIDIDGFLFYAGDVGIIERTAWIEIDFAVAGTGAWQPFQAFVDPVAAWQPETLYNRGDLVRPEPPNGHRYRLQSHQEALSSDTQPNFNTGAGSFTFEPRVNSQGEGIGALVWEEAGPHFTTSSAIQIVSASRKPLRLTFSRAVASGQYDVRVRRLSEAETDPRATSDIVWGQLRSYQPDTADYTGQKRYALAIRASGQLSGTINQFNAIASARVLAWNGAAFVLSETSNPAWIYLWFARGKFDAGGRRLFGVGLADARIDIETLKLWGAFCDANSLTFDGVIDRAMNCTEVLAAIAQCGDAAPTWATGMLGVVFDAANQPSVAVFGMGNIKRSTFQVQYLTGDLADEIIVHFVNPDLGWQEDTVRQVVPGVVQPVRPADVYFFGCVVKNMAGRKANLLAAQQLFRRRLISWEADLEGTVVQRGDVVTLSHDLTQWGYSGRVVASQGVPPANVVLTLSRKVPFTPLENHVVGVVFPNGFYQIFDVQLEVGETDVITLTEAWPTVDDQANPLFTPSTDPNHPPYDYKFVFDPKSTPGKLVKITGVKPITEHLLRLTATDEDPAYYAAESGAFIYVPPQTFGLPTPAISNLQVSDTLVRAGSGFATRITVAWNVEGPYGGAVIRAAPIGEPLQVVGTADTRSFTYQGPDAGKQRIEVAVYNGAGQRGPTGVSEIIYLILGKDRVPGPVTGLAFDGLYATWTDIADVDKRGYAVRYHQGIDSDWETATAGHNGFLTEARFSTRDIAQAGSEITLLVKSLDTSGNESTEAASLVVDLRPGTPTGLAFDGVFLTFDDATEEDHAGFIVRVNTVDDWATAQPTHDEGYITETRLDTRHFEGGEVYLLVKKIDEAGNQTDVAASLLVDLRPVQPNVFLISRQPDGTREFYWETTAPPAPGDLAGAVIRWFLGSTSDWDAMEPLQDGLLTAAPFETNALAAGTYTFAIKNVDEAGNQSANARFIQTTIGDPRIANALADKQESPTWSGTKTDCHADSGTGWLLANDQTTWDTLPATWDAWISWIFDPETAIQYEVLFDIGVVATFQPLVSITVDGAPTILEAHSDDGINYTSFAVPPTEVTARFIKIRVTVTGTFPKIKSMRTTLSAQLIENIVEDQNSAALTGAQRIGVGDVRIPLAQPMSFIKLVHVTLQSTGGGWTWELIDKDTTDGPRIKIYNASNTLADAVFDAIVRGLPA